MRLPLIAAVVVAVGVVVEAGVVPSWRNSKPNTLTRRPRETEEWCDDVLGCLYITDEWYHPTRPVNCLPDPRASINTNFMLHTNVNPALDQNIHIIADKATIDATTFDPTKPIKFITHGFIDTGNLAWLKEMAQAFLAYGEYNVIRVDWGDGPMYCNAAGNIREMAQAFLAYGEYNVIRVDWGDGSLPMYCNAAGNIRVVGLEIAYLVNFFIDEYGVDPANVHLLGHSLGSHASGYAGEKIAGLGRISGLDPAGPYFTGTPEFIRIDTTDAVYVDNIHTDADTILMLGYGTEQPMGNLDFYPNSGHDQPGCDPVNIGIEVIVDLPEGIRDLAACSHGRAYKLFTDSLKQPCPYLAHECFDYTSFELGRCASCDSDNTKCAYMGIRADEYVAKTREHVSMFFDTDEEAPYCYYHYQLIVDTAAPSDAEEWVQGHLTVTLFGDNGETITNLLLTDQHERFDHGQPKYFMFKSHTDLSRVIRMEAHWEYDDTLTNVGSYCWMLLCNRALYLRSIRIAPMDYYPEDVRIDHQRTLCQFGQDYVEIKHDTTEVLVYDETCQFSVGRANPFLA